MPAPTPTPPPSQPAQNNAPVDPKQVWRVLVHPDDAKRGPDTATVRVVVFGAGTGNPYFSTDTAAALRAMEMKADVILKATKVDGIYNADPMLHPDASRYDRISYLQVLEQGLKVMDATAISLCMDNKLPIVVFNLRTPGNITRAICGEPIGSLVTA